MAREISGLGLGAATACVVLVGTLHWHALADAWLDILVKPRFVEIAVMVLLDSLLALLVVASIGRIWRAFNGARLEVRRDQGRREAFLVLKSRYAGIFSRDDEAINGLASTLAFGGPMMVRLKTWWGGLYNGIVAPIGDQFIWSQLSKRSQGNDLGGVRLVKVLTAPIQDVDRFQLSETATESLTLRANQKTFTVAAGIRAALYSIAFGSQPIDYLKRASQEAGAIESLVHTSYFADATTRQVLYEAIAGKSAPLQIPTVATTVEAPRFALLERVWAIGVCLVSASLAFFLYTLLQPIQFQTMLASAVARSNFLAATYADPEKPYRLLHDLAAHRYIQQARDLVAQVQQYDDRKVARAAIAMGLLKSGAAEEGRRIVVDLLTLGPTRSELPLGTLGPDTPLPSLGDSAIARSLGMFAMSSEAVAFINSFDGDLARKKLATEVLSGAVLGKHFEMLPHWTEPSGAGIDRPEIVAQAIESMCADPLSPTDPVADEVVAARIKRDQRCGVAFDLPTALATISEAPVRVNAAGDLARFLASNGKANEANALLSAERSAFPRFKRAALEGLAIHHVRYALAFMDIGDFDTARAIMSSIESVGGEKFKDDSSESVADDRSARERAIAWARLGDADRAIAWWEKLPEEMSELETKLQTLLEMTAHLSRLGKRMPSSERIGHRRAEDAQRWSRMTEVYVAIGEYDSLARTSNRWRRGNTLDAISDRAGLIDDPNQRSLAYERIAERMIEIGMPRTAMSVAARCQPVEQVSVLGAAAAHSP
jgi:tetratricopeptide (TPR) repeat protein